MTPSAEEIGWAGGLFEGEGCLGRYGNVFVMRIHSTDEDVVRRFRDVVERGTVYGPYENSGKDGSIRKPFWAWVCQGRAECGVLIELFAPWLGKRRLARAGEIGIYP